MEVKGKRSFQCPFDGCGKVFSKSSNLRQHERIHSGDKPFVCNICDMSFCQSGNLLKHKRSHENPSLKWNRQTSEKPFKCTLEGCERSFTAKSSLQTHMKTNHLDNSLVWPYYNLQHNPLIDGPPFICCTTNCKEIFLTKATLVEHLKTHYAELQTPSVSSFVGHHCTQLVCSNNYTSCDHMAQWYPGLVAENRFLKNTLSVLLNCVDSLQQSINTTVSEQVFGAVDLVKIRNDLNQLTRLYGNLQPENQRFLQQPLQQPLTVFNPDHLSIQDQQHQLQLQQLQMTALSQQLPLPLPLPLELLQQRQRQLRQPLLSSNNNSSGVISMAATDVTNSITSQPNFALPPTYNVTNELNSVAKGWQAHQIDYVEIDNMSSDNSDSSTNSSCDGSSENNSRGSSGSNISHSIKSNKLNLDVFNNSSNIQNDQCFHHLRYNPNSSSVGHKFVGPNIHYHPNNSSVRHNTVEQLDSSIEIIRAHQYHQQKNQFLPNSFGNIEQNRLLPCTQMNMDLPTQYYTEQNKQPTQHTQQIPSTSLPSMNNSSSSSGAPHISLSEAVEFVSLLFDEPAAVCGETMSNNTIP